LNNVFLLPLQDNGGYHEMLVDADVCVITQQAGSGAFFFPSKLLTTLAWQKPVLTVADDESELVRALYEGEFGLNVLPGKAADVAGALQQLAADGSKLEEFAVAGRRYISRFAMDRVLGEFAFELERVVGEAFPRPTAVKVAPAS